MRELSEKVQSARKGRKNRGVLRIDEDARALILFHPSIYPFSSIYSYLSLSPSTTYLSLFISLFFFFFFLLPRFRFLLLSFISLLVVPYRRKPNLGIRSTQRVRLYSHSPPSPPSPFSLSV